MLRPSRGTSCFGTTVFHLQPAPGAPRACRPHGALLFALAGCGATDPQADKTARAAYAHIARGEDGAFVAMMVPGEAADNARANMSMIHQLVPPGPPPEGKATAWYVNAGTNGATTTLTHVYSYSDRDVSVQTTLVQAGDPPKWEVYRININTNMKAAGGPPPSNVAPAANAAPIKP